MAPISQEKEPPANPGRFIHRFGPRFKDARELFQDPVAPSTRHHGSLGPSAGFDNDRSRELASENESLKQRLDTAQKQKRQSNPRVIESLQKLVIGMARAGYRFDPARPRNPATADIGSDLDKLGIHLDDETILARLREAAELLPRDAKEDEDP